MQRAATGRRCTLQRARAPLPWRRRLCSGPLQGGLSGEVLRRHDASPALMRPTVPALRQLRRTAGAAPGRTVWCAACGGRRGGARPQSRRRAP